MLSGGELLAGLVHRGLEPRLSAPLSGTTEVVPLEFLHLGPALGPAIIDPLPTGVEDGVYNHGQPLLGGQPWPQPLLGGSGASASPAAGLSKMAFFWASCSRAQHRPPRRLPLTDSRTGHDHCNLMKSNW